MRISLTRNSISNLIATCLFLLPIVRYYDMFGIGIGSLLFCIIVVASISLKTYGEFDLGLASAKNSYLLFSCWAILITVIYMMTEGLKLALGQVFIPLLAIAFFVVLFDNKIDFSDTIKIYEKFILICIAIYLLQWVTILLGFKISFKIPFFSYNSAYRYLESYYFGVNFGYPTSLFSEPAHFAEYLVPFIAICLYSKKSGIRRPLLKAAILSVITVASSSGNGIIVVLIEWFLFFILYGAVSKKTKLAVSLLIIPAFAFAFFRLQDVERFAKIYTRLFVNTVVEGGTTKADYRVYRGWDIYLQLPILQKIFGVGYVNMASFAQKHSIVSVYDSTHHAYEFFSTITQIFLYFGMVGAILFLRTLFVLFRSSSKCVKGLIIMSIALWFSSQMFLANTYYMYLFLIVTMYVKEKNNEEVCV